jgi:hypothetical protein
VIGPPANGVFVGGTIGTKLGRVPMDGSGMITGIPVARGTVSVIGPPANGVFVSGTTVTKRGRVAVGGTRVGGTGEAVAVDGTSVDGTSVGVAVGGAGVGGAIVAEAGAGCACVARGKVVGGVAITGDAVDRTDGTVFVFCGAVTDGAKAVAEGEDLGDGPAVSGGDCRAERPQPPAVRSNTTQTMSRRVLRSVLALI